MPPPAAPRRRPEAGAAAAARRPELWVGLAATGLLRAGSLFLVLLPLAAVQLPLAYLGETVGGEKLGAVVLGRSSWATLLAAVVLVYVGAALGNSADTGKDVVGLLGVLLGLKGDVRSQAWLWVARAALGLIALEVVVFVRTRRRGHSLAP